MDSYDRIVERIATNAKLGVDEIERRVEGKRAKLSGLISKEGAAHIVAAELGISFDNELLTIAELADGMKRARVIGKITRINPTRSFSKNGKEGKVGSFNIGDQTSNIRIVLWDVHHIDFLEKDLKEGAVVEITNGNMRNGELHLGAFSDLKVSTQKLAEVKVDAVMQAGTLAEARPGAKMKVRAVIVQLFDPKFFESKKNPGEQRALFNLVLDDGTETIRAVAGQEQIMALGLTEEDIKNAEKFIVHKENLLGEECFFNGTVRTNAYFNKPEFSIQAIERVTPEALLQGM